MLELNYDILGNILFYLGIDNILGVRKICNHFNNYYKSDDMIQILSSKLNMKNASLNQLLLRYHRNTIMASITLLAPLYNTSFGLTNDLAVYHPSPNEFDIMRYIDSAINNGGTMSGVLTSVPLGNIKIKYHKLTITFDESYIKMVANKYIHFKTVIIKYESADVWAVKPRFEWYNLSQCEDNMNSEAYLPLLNTRPWIKIDDPFMQVSISAEIKGSPLTIDDILFAARSLSADTSTKISKAGNYLIRNDDNYDILCIEPDIY